MKKFLFTLAALMMAGSLCAEEYFYIDDFEVAEGQTTLEIPVKAHFEAAVSAFQVDIMVPDGIIIDGDAEAGADMTLSYYNNRGASKTTSVTLNQTLVDGSDNHGRYIAASTQGGYYQVDGSWVQYGAVKWLPGDYDEMWILYLIVEDGFKGGEIVVESRPTCGYDARPDVEPCEKGNVYTKVCNVTVEGGSEPEVTEAPVITYETTDDAVIITATGAGVVTLYINNEPVENPYTIARGEEDTAVLATAYAQEEGKEISAATTVEVPVPAKEVAPQPEVTPTPTITVDENYNLIVEGEGEIHVYVNGEEVQLPYTFEQTEEDVTYVITATAQGEGKEISAVATFEVTIPAKQGVDPEDPHMAGKWIVLIDKRGEEHWYEMYADQTGDANWSIMLTLHHNPWGETAEFYFMVDGVRYGAETDMYLPAMGEASQTILNPVFEGDNLFYVVAGYRYTFGLQFGNGQIYLLVAQGTQTGVNELNGEKAVAGVRYFNMAGQEMQEANGMTIVVTTYTDGTTSAVKVMK